MTSAEEDGKKAYEERLQRRLLILKKQIEDGKVKFARGIPVAESLKAVRYGPDGSVDLRTVDSMVRSLALAVEAVHDREEAKASLPLADIQRAYFALIERNLGEFHKTMLENRVTPHDIGMSISRSPSAVKEIVGQIPDFLGSIQEFWKAAAFAAQAHVEDMRGALKGVFGGDLFPSQSENIASKCGIYTDTVILPDPFIRSQGLFTLWTPEQQIYYLIKHGLNVLQYREVACAEIDPPIVVVLPDRAYFDEGEMRFILDLGKRDALAHSRRVFGREFASFEALMEFAGGLDSVDRVIAEVADPDRVLFDVEWEGSLKDKIERATHDQPAKLLGTANPGTIVASLAVGRMGVSNELLIKARRLRGIPIIDAPTSWRYFVWKLEYDASSAEQQSGMRSLHIVRGLQELAENKMEWLGRVPPRALIELRKSGAMGEVREILGKGVSELCVASPGDFQRTCDQVFANIREAFTAHKENIEAVKK